MPQFCEKYNVDGQKMARNGCKTAICQSTFFETPSISTFLRLSLFFCRKTYVDDVLVHPGICNIPIVDGQSLTNREFLKQFAYERPFVLRDATDNIVSCDQSLTSQVL